MIARAADTVEAGGEDAEIIMDVYCLKTTAGHCRVSVRRTAVPAFIDTVFM